MNVTDEEPEYRPHPDDVYTKQISVAPPDNFDVTPVADDDTAPKLSQKPFVKITVFQNVDSHSAEVRSSPCSSGLLSSVTKSV